MIRVVIADRQQMVREGIRRLLDDRPEFSVVAEAGDQAGTLEAVKATAPDVVIVDIALGGPDTVRLIGTLKASRPAPRVLALCGHAQDAGALQALHAGTDGTITRENSAEELFGALRRIAAGGRYVCPAIAERLALDLTAPSADAPVHTRLSEREYAIFELLISGRRGSEIAQALSLSEKTVSTHKAHVLRKLNLGNVSDLMRYAIRHQLVAP
jgi:DNA-binding NarL/FixJ family response regulator